MSSSSSSLSAVSEKVRRILNTTASQVALEFGYSEHSILCFYEPNIRAGDLVRKILDAEEDGVIISKPQWLLEEEENWSREAVEKEKRLICLRMETLQLWRRSMCYSCRACKSDMLALPCAHLHVCRKCITDVCFVCKTPVIDWIRVHM